MSRPHHGALYGSPVTAAGARSQGRFRPQVRRYDADRAAVRVQQAPEEFVLAQGDDPVRDVEGRVGRRQVGLQAEDVADRVQAGLQDEVLGAADGGAVAGLGQADEGVADLGEVGGRDPGPEGDGDRPAAE
jgi:hypothetical protein